MDRQRIRNDPITGRTKLNRLGQNRGILYRIDGDAKLAAQLS
ncbi:MAG: hypothetical protein WAV28_17750 [Sedimentisphaerales bacterium]